MKALFWPISLNLIFCAVFLTLTGFVLAQETPRVTPEPLPVDADIVEADASQPLKKIEVGVGQTETIAIDGQNPFMADDTIATIEVISPVRIAITGMKVGTTQLLYYKEGVLTSMIVEVTVPPTLTVLTQTPVFRSNRPFFRYSFTNTSAFDKNTFFSSPSYFHTLESFIPFPFGAKVTATTSFNHGVGAQEKIIQRGNLAYYGRRLTLELGEVITGMTQLLSIPGGANLLGGDVAYRLVQTENLSHGISLVGGTVNPFNLLDTKIREQLYGIKYTIDWRTVPGRFFKDFINAGFVAYEPKDSNTFRPAGFVEGSYHVTSNLALGGGYAQDPGGFQIVFSPFYETEKGLIQGNYTFLRHGIANFAQSPAQDDRHESLIRYQYLLKDNKTFLNASIFQQTIIPKGDSETLASNTLGGFIGIHRTFSYQNTYGATYGVSYAKNAGQPSLTNQISLDLSHALAKSSYLSHSAAYDRTDLSDSINNISLSSTYTLELERFKYTAGIGTAVSFGSANTQSLFVTQDAQIIFTKAALRSVLSYKIPSLSEGEHQVQLLQSLLLLPTSVDRLALSTGLVYLPAGSEFNGTIGLTYQRLFGPGVRDDSLLKAFFKGGIRATIKGTVFHDTNYNSFLNKDEKPLVGVRLTLDGRQTATTDVNGNFLFKRVKSGRHVLKVDVDSIPLADKPKEIPAQTLHTAGEQTLEIPVPIFVDKATLVIRFYLDTNGNGEIDDGDSLADVGEGYVELPSGEVRRFLTAYRGGGLVRGLEAGTYTVGIDPLKIPDNVQALDKIEKSVIIRDYQEYKVRFLFKPIRSLRGRVIVAGPKKFNPQSLVIELGKAASRVDAQGLYWLKGLLPGTHRLVIKNLPKSYCLQSGTPDEVQIPEGPFLEKRDIVLTRKCANQPAP